MKALCKIADCARESDTRGMCLMHYKRARKAGEFVCAKRPEYEKTCVVEGCETDAEKRGYCGKHYRRLQRNGHMGLVRQAPGGLVKMAGGYLLQTIDGVKKLHHVRVVEAVLGRTLPRGVEVHHVNEITSDNRHENLVVCQDRQYHMTLHARQRALDACGNANWKKCRHCKVYDDPANMSGRASRGQELNTFWHKACASKHTAAMKAKKKAETMT